jgi:bacillithiol system protein YtxJ
MRQLLTAQAQAEALILSGTPSWILKHSSSCGISGEALAEVDGYLQAHAEEELGMVVVQSHRPLSSWLAERLRVPHQSPQLFLLRTGVVLWRASHWGITRTAMEAARAAVANSP